MKKNEKLMLLLCIPLAVLCLIAFVLLGSMKSIQDESIVYPQGSLSDSLFVSQNNSYTSQEGLTQVHAFQTVPYLADIFEGTKATVGDSSIYQVNEETYLYITEYDVSKKAEEVLLAEFPSALLIDYDSAYTFSQKMQSQSGYINGFSANYLFDMISVTNAEITKTAYVAAYELMNVDNLQMNHMLIGVVTTSTSSESFLQARQILDAVTSTVRYDEKLNNKQKKEQEETEDKQNLQEKVKEEEPEQNVDIGISEESLISDTDVDAKLIPVNVNAKYQDMNLVMSYEMPSPLSEITLYDPDGSQIYEKQDDGQGKVTFHVGDNRIGSYLLKVTYAADLGKISVQVGEVNAAINSEE